MTCSSRRSVPFLLLLAFLLWGALQPAAAIPAFARKYGLPCSACHEAWPMLNVFGQTFKDNGYQLMNDRDAPIWQNPEYFSLACRRCGSPDRWCQNRSRLAGPPRCWVPQLRCRLPLCWLPPGASWE